MIELGDFVTVEGEVLAVDPADGPMPRLVLLRVEPGTGDTTNAASAVDAAVQKLRAHRNNPEYIRFFRWLSGFVRNRSETAVKRASDKTMLREEKVKAIFHSLEEAGIGRYNKGGRGGHKPRFCWTLPLTDVTARFLSHSRV